MGIGSAIKRGIEGYMRTARGIKEGMIAASRFEDPKAARNAGYLMGLEHIKPGDRKYFHGANAAAVGTVYALKNKKKDSKKDSKFFGHSKVGKQNIVKNPPKQVPQLGKDGFYSNVKNCTGRL